MYVYKNVSDQKEDAKEFKDITFNAVEKLLALFILLMSKLGQLHCGYV